MHRDDFYVPGPGPYCLTHSVGCLPKLSVDAIHANYLQPWQLLGGDAWDSWLTVIAAFKRASGAAARRQCGRLLSAIKSVVGSREAVARDPEGGSAHAAAGRGGLVSLARLCSASEVLQAGLQFTVARPQP